MKKYENKNPEGKSNLTNNGVGGFIEISITPGDQPKVDNGVETVVENPSKIFNHERGTGWIQSLIVNREIYFLGNEF